MRWPPSTAGYSAATRGRTHRRGLAATGASEPLGLLPPGWDTSSHSQPTRGRLASERPTRSHPHAMQIPYVPYGLSGGGRRAQTKTSNAIVSRVHSAIVKKRDARSEVTIRGDAFRPVVPARLLGLGDTGSCNRLRLVGSCN